MEDADAQRTLESVTGWIARQNFEKGFAPSAQVVREEYETAQPLEEGAGLGKKSTQRWVRRLRGR